MRASTVFVALFATLAVATPNPVVEHDGLDVALDRRQCSAAGVCSKGGDKGENCSALKCCSNSKSGRGNSVCCCN
ncbi:uncharacterized protein CTRU02_207735 [Colletotrichum truncatum]|uniref:Uncharacterized protein n=1 Tax=Colletotrichum truncatum TaxID=5467 RepID=A0ACC3Z1P9_COLTU|nr:uncharacterized protein CTRU02_09160 [Colletotrichum truncatum]KAF6788839.1 hypothetical protein CTRU02_09160 [Colletotrichum truncatum]